MPVSECRSETYPPSLFPAAGPVARSTPSRPTDERLGWVSPPSFAGARPRDPGGARSLGSSSEVARKKNPGEISVTWADSWLLFSWLARGTGSVQRFSRCTFRGAALFGRVARAGDDVGRRRRTHRRAPDGISRGELTVGAWREVGSRGGAPGGAPRVLVPRRRPRRRCVHFARAARGAPAARRGIRRRRAASRRLVARRPRGVHARRVTRRGVRGVAAATDPPKATRGRGGEGAREDRAVARGAR